MGAEWWAWSFVPLCALYMVFALAHLDHMLVNTYGSSDVSSAPVLGELYPGRLVGHVVLAILPFYSTLLFEDATRWLPAHRAVWEVGPYILALVSIALMSWATWRVAGRWAAALTAAILLCAGPTVLEYMLWLNDHATSWYSLALLAAFLVLVNEHGERIGWPGLAALTLVVGVIVGVNAASDTLLLLAGLLPLLFAGVGAWMLGTGARAARTMGCSLAAAAAIAMSAVATTSIMHAGGILRGELTLRFATEESISSNLRSWWESIATLANGSFFGAAVSFTSVMALICAAISIGAVLLIPRFTWLQLADWRAREDPVEDRAAAYMMFWTASAVCLSISFVLSGTTDGTGTNRYLVGLVYAVAAIVPLLARRASVKVRAVIVAGACVYLLNSFVALADSGFINAPSDQGPSPQVAADVARVGERLHAIHGFALYWDASSITWRSNFRVVVAPIVGCENPNYPGALCAGPYNYLQQWYRIWPYRTFVLTDSSGADDVWQNPKLGPTIATYHFGTVTMYVYNHDVASTLFKP
ncbi:MAG TPA: hypothetical protein VNV37_12770 [Solirubrobacteraceae bacterium]|nr:hypothetical protein [Solirubrobacteraceae bacterium]